MEQILKTCGETARRASEFASAAQNALELLAKTVTFCQKREMGTAAECGSAHTILCALLREAENRLLLAVSEITEAQRELHK